ncbi:MAG: diversity-generating retroelement protein Avd [Candidatus Eisenbacteria bacterium]|nr:diversity-generating retroelement protein Avd [Candidatus Eisenbacteria bacterium]
MSALVTVVPKAYDLALWLILRVNEFPPSQRFALGQRMDNTALDLLDLLVEAQFERDKQDLLRRANLTLVRLRHLVRLANDLHVLGARRYEFASEHLEELGRMVGGWAKHEKTRPRDGER